LSRWSPQYIYPLDYGYLAGTTSADFGGIDIWPGSLDRSVRGVIATIDLWKRATARTARVRSLSSAFFRIAATPASRALRAYCR